MSIRQVPAERPGDADILASLQGLYPVPSGSIIELVPRHRVMDLISELHQTGEGDVGPLLKALEFDGEAAFRNGYSQMSSCKLSFRTSTIFMMLRAMSETGESRSEVLRRALVPAVEEALERIVDSMDEGRAHLLRYSLDNWKGLRRSTGDLIEPGDERCGDGGAGLSHRTCMEGESLPPELNKTSRYFLKNLFRLNNLHDENDFYHPPEVVEDYWEVISPDQGTFDVRMTPSRKELTVGLFRTTRGFGMNRTENEDYYNLLELLASERRDPRIHGCRVELHGPTFEDEQYLQEALSVETVLVEDPVLEGTLAGKPRPLSPEGLRAFRSLLRKMSGIRAEVQFPVNLADPEHGQEDFSVLGFDLAYDPDADRFLLDDTIVSPGTLQDVVLVIGSKLLALSRRVYPRPAAFPEPDMGRLEEEVHALIARAENKELTEELAREIVAKITILDYYESLARYSFSLGEQLLAYLEGEHIVTLPIPRVLQALLNVGLGEGPADDRLLAGLRSEDEE
jgi:hypothetical protein